MNESCSPPLAPAESDDPEAPEGEGNVFVILHELHALLEEARPELGPEFVDAGEHALRISEERDPKPARVPPLGPRGGVSGKEVPLLHVAAAPPGAVHAADIEVAVHHGPGGRGQREGAGDEKKRRQATGHGKPPVSGPTRLRLGRASGSQNVTQVDALQLGQEEEYDAEPQGGRQALGIILQHHQDEERVEQHLAEEVESSQERVAGVEQPRTWEGQRKQRRQARRAERRAAAVAGLRVRGHRGAALRAVPQRHALGRLRPFQSRTLAQGKDRRRCSAVLPRALISTSIRRESVNTSITWW